MCHKLFGFMAMAAKKDVQTESKVVIEIVMELLRRHLRPCHDRGDPWLMADAIGRSQFRLDFLGARTIPNRELGARKMKAFGWA